MSAILSTAFFGRGRGAGGTERRQCLHEVAASFRIAFHILEYTRHAIKLFYREVEGGSGGGGGALTSPHTHTLCDEIASL